MRKTLAILAIGASLLAGGMPANAADDVEPDAATNQGYNDGENGFQTISINVTPSTSRHADDVLLKVAGDCEFTTVGKPNTNQTILAVVAHATTTVHSQNGVPVSTGVKCSVRNAHGGVTVNTALPLNSIAGAGEAEVTYGEFTMCIQVSVHYNNNEFVRSREVCRLPISPI